MVDPVSTAVAQKVVKESRGVIMSILMAPIDLIKGLFSGTFEGVMGAGKGLIGGTLGDPLGVLTLGGVLFGVIKYMPSIPFFVSEKIKALTNGRIDLATRFVEDEKTGGTMKAAMDAGLAALAIKATMGVAGGTLAGATDSTEGREKSMAESAGGFLGSAAILGGLGYLAFNTISSTKIGAAEHVEPGNKTPTPLSAGNTTPAIPQHKPSPAIPN